ncbi:MAG: hypothetical protein ACOX52_01275 [Verrucomicrobiota bacterium]
MAGALAVGGSGRVGGDFPRGITRSTDPESDTDTDPEAILLHVRKVLGSGRAGLAQRGNGEGGECKASGFLL